MPDCRLCAAGGEIDFSRRTAQTAGNVLPCLQQGFCGSLPYVVQTGGVAVVLFQTGQHSTHCRFRGLCGSCIICVYLQWGFLRFLRTKSGDCRWFPALPAFLLIISSLLLDCFEALLQICQNVVNSSIPIDSRTVVGVMPAASSSSSVICEWVVDARMDHQRFHVCDVCQQREDLRDSVTSVPAPWCRSVRR